MTDAPIFGLALPEIRWFVNIRFPKKERLVALTCLPSDPDIATTALKGILGFDPYEDLVPTVYISETIPAESARIPRIVADRFKDYFFQFHDDVFESQLNESDDNYSDNILLWQGVAVYHIVAVTKNNSIYGNMNDACIKEAREFSSRMCQWAISVLNRNLRSRARLSLTQKCFLWMDLSALDQLMRREERGVLEKLAGPTEFARLKSTLGIQVKDLDRELMKEIEYRVEGVVEEIYLQRADKFGETTLWLEFLDWKWKLVQIAEICGLDEEL